jgi:serine/threonine protein kinase
MVNIFLAENIFLTQKDVLKLGDFGCSFRLHDTVTHFGEIVNYVGTTQYMAPEMQTNGGTYSEVTGNSSGNSSYEYIGYGRAVDIWSTGCVSINFSFQKSTITFQVVLEMLTGKKPYHYLNHEFQIIYQLGSGTPPRLTPEIQQCELTHTFLKKCFTISPFERPTAKELLQDPFANIMPQVIITYVVLFKNSTF